MKKIWSQIKLLFAARKTLSKVQDDVSTIRKSYTKWGLKSSEFWLHALASGGSILAAVSGLLSPQYAAIMVALSGAAYSMSRGMAKETVPGAGKKAGYKTTEFWVAMAADLGAVLTAAAGAVDPNTAAALVTISRVAYAVSRGLAKKDDHKTPAPLAATKKTASHRDLI